MPANRANKIWDSAYQGCWKKSSDFKKGHGAGRRTVNRCSAKATAALKREGLTFKDVDLGALEARRRRSRLDGVYLVRRKRPGLDGVGDDLPPWVLPAALGALVVLIVR